MRHDSEGHIQAAEQYVKRVNIVFSPQMLDALNGKAQQNSSTTISLLRSYLKMKEMVDKQTAEEARDGKDTTLRAGDVVIDTTGLLGKFGKPEPRSRFNLLLPFVEYNAVEAASNSLGLSVSSYVRSAAALGLEVQGVVDGSDYPKFEGYPLSVGEKKFLLIF